MIIYKITNISNNKNYIGQTKKDINKRFIEHLSSLRNNKHVNMYLQRAYNKHGRDTFKIEQIDSALTLEELNYKEEYWIKFYDSMNRDKGYNLIEGGRTSKRSLETRKRISEGGIGRVVSKETKEKIANTLRGRKHTKQRKLNISKSMKGVNHPFFGKKRPEYGALMSKINKEKKRLAALNRSDEI